MTFTFSSFSFANLKMLLRQFAESQLSLRPALMSEVDEVRAARAFLHDMMGSHPEATQSELDLMILMALYPKHF